MKLPFSCFSVFWWLEERKLDLDWRFYSVREIIMNWMEENESFLAFSLHLALIMMQVTPLTEQCPAAFVFWKKAGGFFLNYGSFRRFLYVQKASFLYYWRCKVTESRRSRGQNSAINFMSVSADVSSELPEQHNLRSFYFSCYQSVWRAVKKPSIFRSIGIWRNRRQ